MNDLNSARCIVFCVCRRGSVYVTRTRLMDFHVLVFFCLERSAELWESAEVPEIRC